MKKSSVVIISFFLLIGFGLLISHGLRRSRGIPVAAEKREMVLLEAAFLDKEIDLSKGISPELWENIAPRKIEFLYQLTVLPWPKKRKISPATVKGFHNGEDIYFYIRWEDETKDTTLGTNEFSDACAIMFPLGEDAQPPTIMMGFLGKANIWQWKANKDREYWDVKDSGEKAYADFYYPFEEEELFTVSKDVLQSAVNDLIAIRVGTITPKEKQGVSGRGFWEEGIWQVVFKRSLKSLDPELDAVLSSTGKRLCAFALWNGAKGDRAGRKSISDWVTLSVSGLDLGHN